MANTNKPDGFTPAYHMYGGVIRPAKMRIASATNASIFSGDVVNYLVVMSFKARRQALL
tara:strand:+ start:55 stop:231 length:177 start_codon:yes stop_codon:yes gene_type:complete